MSSKESIFDIEKNENNFISIHLKDFQTCLYETPPSRIMQYLQGVLQTDYHISDGEISEYSDYIEVKLKERNMFAKYNNKEELSKKERNELLLEVEKIIWKYKIVKEINTPVRPRKKTYQQVKFMNLHNGRIRRRVAIGLIVICFKTYESLFPKPISIVSNYQDKDLTKFINLIFDEFISPDSCDLLGTFLLESESTWIATIKDLILKIVTQKDLSTNIQLLRKYWKPEKITNFYNEIETAISAGNINILLQLAYNLNNVVLPCYICNLHTMFLNIITVFFIEDFSLELAGGIVNRSKEELIFNIIGSYFQRIFIDESLDDIMRKEIICTSSINKEPGLDREYNNLNIFSYFYNIIHKQSSIPCFALKYKNALKHILSDPKKFITDTSNFYFKEGYKAAIIYNQANQEPSLNFFPYCLFLRIDRKDRMFAVVRCSLEKLAKGKDKDISPGMKAIFEKVNDETLWNIVNYIIFPGGENWSNVNEGKFNPNEFEASFFKKVLEPFIDCDWGILNSFVKT